MTAPTLRSLKLRRVCVASIAGFITSILVPAPSVAQTESGWTGIGADTNWSTTGNWDNGSPILFGAPDFIRDLTFGTAYATAGGLGSLVSNNDISGYEGYRITFESTGAFADPAFTIIGNGFTLFDFGGNAPRIENQSNALQTFNLGGVLTLNGGTSNVAQINPSGGDLRFQNAIALAGGTQLQVGGSLEKTVTFNGAISGGATNSVAINGNTHAVYGAANTYGGDTYVNAGSLTMAAGGSVAVGTTIHLGDTVGFEDATLTLGSATGGVTVGNLVNVRAGIGGARTVVSTNTSGTNALSGGLVLASNLRTQTTTGGTLAISGAVDLKFNLLTIDGTGATTISSAVGNSEGAGGIVKIGTGSLTLSGTNTFGGGVSVEGGTVNVANDGNLGQASGGLFLRGGTLNATGALNMSRVVVLEGSGSLVTLASNSVWSGVLTGDGGFTKNGAGNLTLAGGTGNDLGGAITLNQGTLFLNKTAGNAIGIGGFNANSNNTAGFGAAIVSLSKSEQIDDNAAISLSAAGGMRAGLDLNNFTETVGAVTISSVTNGTATIALGGTGKLILNGDLTFNANRNATGNTAREVMITGTGTLGTVGVGGTVDLGGVERNIIVQANNTQVNSDATIESVITNGTLVKKGNRALRLGAVNTYDGLIVSNGSVRALVNGAIPQNVPLTVSGTDAGTTATLDFNGLDYTLRAANNLKFGGGAGASTIATGTGTLTLETPLLFDLTNNSQTLTVSGKLNTNGQQDTFDVADSAGTATDVLISATISGLTNGMVKTGSGTLALGGTNFFNGPVVINGGSLAPRANNAISGQIFVTGGGALLMDTGGVDNTAYNNFLGATTNNITIDDGYFRATSNTDRTITGRYLNIGPTGATFDIAGSYNNFVEGALTQVRFTGGTNPTTLNGSGAFTKEGGGRIQFQTASAAFSGPIILNNGTTEASGVALGNSSETNTITINGGNWAVTGDSTQPLVTLNGGAISTNGASRTVHGEINVASSSYVFLNNFWTDAASGWTLTLPGVVGGPGDLTVAVNRAGYDNNSGTLLLQNPGNTLTGTITVGKNLNLTNSSATGSGKTLGSASVVLQDGKLNLRDNGAASGSTLDYGTDVEVSSPVGITGNGDNAGTATISVDRVNGKYSNNTIELGSLTIGGQQLDVTGGSGYKLSFGGVTTLTGTPTFNVNASSLTFAGGLAGGTNTFTKTGPGTLRLLGTIDHGGYTLTGGSIELPTEPTGIGRTLDLVTGTGFGAGYAATQANLIDRVTLTSAGVVSLGAASTFNPDFTGFTGGLRLGATADATLTGTITPADDTVRLGGGGSTLTLASANAINGNVNLDVNTSGTAAGTVVLGAANAFTGNINIGGGMILRAANLSSLGSNTAVSMDNGTLQLTGGGDFAGLEGWQFTAGAGGATLDTNGVNVTLNTAITGTGTFAKAGDGTLVLNNAATTFAGKTAVRGGVLSIGADSHLGQVPGAVTADKLQLAGGTLLATGTFTIPTNRGVNLGVGGGTIDTGANTVTLASVMSGANPFTKEGSGTLRITADPNNSGLYSINAGVLELQHGGSTDAPMVIKDGATLRVLTDNDLGDAHTITVEGGGTFDLRANDTISQLLGSGTVMNGGTAGKTLAINSALNSVFNGVIQNGGAALGFTKGGAGTATFTGAHLYTGGTVVNSGQLAIQGNEAALRASNITVGDNNGGDESMSFGEATDVWSGGELNRIGNTNSLTLNGRVRVSYNGPAATSTGFTETLGSLNVGNGTNVLTLTAAPGAEVELAPTGLLRTSNSSLLLRGDNLGGTGADSSRLMPGSVAVIGGGGGAGSTNLSIVPFVVGDDAGNGAGSSFVTNGATGLRPLTNAEYASGIAGSAGQNVSIGGNETVESSVSINALRLMGGAVTLGADTKFKVASNAILFTGNGGIGGDGTIDFGGRDGIINVAQNSVPAVVSMDTNIQAGAGLTIGSFGYDSFGNNMPHTVVLAGTNELGGLLSVSNTILRFGSSTAINPQAPVQVVFRPGATVQLGGNNVTVRDLGVNSSGGTFALQNAALENATLTAINTANATLSTPIIDGAGGGLLSLVKRSNGTLTLTGQSNYGGTTMIDRGGLVLNGGGRLTSTGGDGSTAITLSGGATLRLTNNSGANQGDRLRNNAVITMRGATFDFDNNASGANYSETTGGLVIDSGFNTIFADQAASANTGTLTFASLARTAGSQSVVSFIGRANDTVTAGTIGANTRNRIVFTAAPTLNDGLIGGWAFVDGTEFATYNTTGTVSVAAAPTTADAETAWDTTKNVKPAGSVTLTGNRTVNSLNFANAQNLNLGGFTLNVDSGGLIHRTSTGADSITNGTITAGATAGSELVIRTSDGAGNLTVSAVIANNAAGAVGLNKTGGGRLTLTGANTYTGATSIGGTLSIADDAVLGAVPATPASGNIRINDGGVLEVTASTTLNANRGIEINGANATIRQTTGTLTYNGAITSPYQTDLTVLGNANLGGAIQVGASANFTNAQTVNITGPASFGGLNVGYHATSGTAVSASTVNVSGESLAVGLNASSGFDLNVGYRTAAPTPDSGTTAGTLDLTGLNSLTAMVGTVRVGVSTAGGTAQVRGDLLLPVTSNITASQGVLIGDSTANGNNGVQSKLQVGTGLSTISTPSIVVGGRKGNGLLTMAAGGTLRLDWIGDNSADLLVAYNNQDATGVTSSGVADFINGTLVADLDELVVGFKSGAGGSTGGATGTMTLSNLAHSVSTNEIRLGDSQSGSTGATSGTLNIGSGTVTVNNNVAIGLRTGSAGTGTGVLNLTGGSLTVGGNITTSISANANSTLNVDGGALDVTGGFINVDTVTLQRGTLSNVAGIYTGDGVTEAATIAKVGAGTLVVDGANTYSAKTNVDAGTLLVSGSLTGAVDVGTAAILGGDGSIGGAVLLKGGASLSPGASIGSLATGNLTFEGASQFNVEINTTTQTADVVNVTGSFTLDGFNTVKLNVTDLAAAPFSGNLVFVTYSGSWTGGLFDVGGNMITDYDPAFQDSASFNIGGNEYFIDYDYNGNSVALVVPEPSAVLSLLGGLGVLLGARRSRRRN